MGWTNADNKYGPTKYVVGTTLGDGVNYTSIQTAINDINATVSKEGLILVRVGNYTENLTIPGGNATQIVGAAGNANISGIVSLIGNVTVGAGAAVSFTHFFIEGNVLNSAGDLIFDDCTVFALAGDALTVSAGSGTTDSRFSVFQATGGNALTYSGGVCTFEECDFPTGPIGISGATAFQPRFNQCTLEQISNLTGTSTAVYSNSFLTVGTFAFNIGGTAQANVWHCTIQASDGSGNWVTGTGTLRYADVILLQNTAIPGTINQLVDVWEPFATTTTAGTAFFNPADFTVSNVGEVSLSGSAGVTWSNVIIPIIVLDNSGSFTSNAITVTLPAAPALGTETRFFDTDGGPLVLQASPGQKIRIGSSLSSIAGTATSSTVGDGLWLTYRDADTTWYGITQGNWILA